MQREVLKYLHDIKESINSIDEYLQGRYDFTEYQKNKLLRRGIERELETNEFFEQLKLFEKTNIDSSEDSLHND